MRFVAYNVALGQGFLRLLVSSPDIIIPLNVHGTAVAQWLRRCATDRKVAGSIPVGVIGIDHLA